MAEEGALELVQLPTGGKLSFADGQRHSPAPETSSDQPPMSYLLRSEGDPGEFNSRITSHTSSDEEEALSGEEKGTDRGKLKGKMVASSSSFPEELDALDSISRDLHLEIVSEASGDQEPSNPLLDEEEEEFSRCLVEIISDGMKEELKKVGVQVKMIYKVLPSIRNLDEDAYTPQFVSFGPYHRGTEALRSADDYKRSFLHQILNMYTDKDKALMMYLKKMYRVKQQMKDCYEVDIQNDNIQMLLLDGCGILGFLGILPLPEQQAGAQTQGQDKVVVEASTVLKYIPKIINKLTRTAKLMAASLLPSSILPQGEVGGQTHREQDKVTAEASTVQKNLSGDNKMPEDMSFAMAASSGLPFDARNNPKESKRTADSAIIMLWHHDSIRHDLLLMENQLPFFALQEIYDLATAEKTVAGSLIGKVDEAIEILLRSYGTYPLPPITNVHHLLHYCHLKFKPAMTNSSCPNGQPKDKVEPKWRSAMDLNKAGIKFKPKLSDPLNKFSLLDVQLVSRRTLMIPTLKIEDSTRSIFRNLIAFEQSSTRENYFAAYAFFMGQLMATPEDVTLLVNQGVVENYIGENKEVSNFFNNLVNGVIFDINGEHFLRSTIKDLNSYYNNKYHKFCVHLKQNYCGSPWQVIPVVVKAAILVFIVVQIVFAVRAGFQPFKPFKPFKTLDETIKRDSTKFVFNTTDPFLEKYLKTFFESWTAPAAPP